MMYRVDPAWSAEVAAAYADVIREYTADEQALLESVPVIAVPHFVQDTRWGACWWRANGPEIEIYLPAFTHMPDQENRSVQLREVVRHELNHALGRNLDEDAPRRDVGLLPWIGAGPLTISTRGMTVSMPEIDR